jgi:hypothetical protein
VSLSFFYLIEKEEKNARAFVTGKPAPIFAGKARNLP